MSLPNLRQALGENVLDSDSEYEDYTTDSDDGSENILDKSCGEDLSDLSDEDFPVRLMNRFAGKKGLELRKKQLKTNQAGKGKRHPLLKYFSSEDVRRLKTLRGSRKDCKMNGQARCEEKLRTDKSFSLFPFQKKIVTWVQTTESGKKTFAEISQCPPLPKWLK